MSTIEKNENEANCVEMSSMDKDITAKYGLPFIKKGENIFAINLGFFSAKIQKVCDLIYYKEEWFEWENDHWKRLDETKLQNQIWNQLNTAIQNAGLQLYDKITPRIIQDIQKMIQMQSNNSVHPQSDENVIPLKNELLCWNVDAHDFRFRQYTRDDMIFDTLDAEYIEGRTSPLFDRKIQEILPNDDDRRIVQEYMGASLFGVNRTRKFLLLQGEGGCGKSLLVSLLSRILTYRRVFDLNFDSLKANYEFSALDGQTLLTASEAVSQAFSQSAGVEFVKKAVGGDFFQTKQKFKNKRVDHFGFFSLIIVSNNALRFKYEGRGDEFKDRQIPIRFTKHIDADKQDKELVEKLLQDRSAILNWLLEGARRVRRNNWNITLSPEQQSRRDRIIEATKGIEIFVQNYVELACGESFTTQNAYEHYTHLQQEEKFEYQSETVFQKRLAKAMSIIHGATPTNTLKGGKARGYSGYALKKS